MINVLTNNSVQLEAAPDYLSYMIFVIAVGFALTILMLIFDMLGRGKRDILFVGALMALSVLTLIGLMTAQGISSSQIGNKNLQAFSEYGVNVDNVLSQDRKKVKKIIEDPSSNSSIDFTSVNVESGDGQVYRITIDENYKLRLFALEDESESEWVPVEVG